MISLHTSLPGKTHLPWWATLSPSSEVELMGTLHTVANLILLFTNFTNCCNSVVKTSRMPSFNFKYLSLQIQIIYLKNVFERGRGKWVGVRKKGGKGK